MTPIQTTCTACGARAALHVADVSLLVASSGDRGAYGFRCGACERIVLRTADAQVIALLGRVGVEPLRLDLPEHPERPRPGAPLSVDDLLDLTLMLRDDGWFSQLVELWQTAGGV